MMVSILMLMTSIEYMPFKHYFRDHHLMEQLFIIDNFIRHQKKENVLNEIRKYLLRI